MFIIFQDSYFLQLSQIQTKFAQKKRYFVTKFFFESQTNFSPKNSFLRTHLSSCEKHDIQYFLVLREILQKYILMQATSDR